MWQNAINSILGVALLVVAYVSPTGTTLSWTLTIIGVLIVALGFWGVVDTDNKTYRHN